VQQGKETLTTQNRYFWTGLSIAAMWIAVLFVGVFGPTMDAGGPTGAVGIPVALTVVAFFALIGTVIVGIFGFRK
jgi:hypothetical protein